MRYCINFIAESYWRYCTILQSMTGGTVLYCRIWLEVLYFIVESDWRYCTSYIAESDWMYCTTYIVESDWRYCLYLTSWGRLLAVFHYSLEAVLVTLRWRRELNGKESKFYLQS